MSTHLDWFSPPETMFIADQNIANGLEWSDEFDTAMMGDVINEQWAASSLVDLWDATRAYCAA